MPDYKENQPEQIRSIKKIIVTDTVQSWITRLNSIIDLTNVMLTQDIDNIPFGYMTSIDKRYLDYIRNSISNVPSIFSESNLLIYSKLVNTTNLKVNHINKIMKVYNIDSSSINSTIAINHEGVQGYDTIIINAYKDFTLEFNPGSADNISTEYKLYYTENSVTKSIKTINKKVKFYSTVYSISSIDVTNDNITTKEFKFTPLLPDLTTTNSKIKINEIEYTITTSTNNTNEFEFTYKVGQQTITLSTTNNIIEIDATKYSVYNENYEYRLTPNSITTSEKKITINGVLYNIITDEENIYSEIIACIKAINNVVITYSGNSWKFVNNSIQPNVNYTKVPISTTQIDGEESTTTINSYPTDKTLLLAGQRLVLKFIIIGTEIVLISVIDNTQLVDNYNNVNYSERYDPDFNE